MGRRCAALGVAGLMLTQLASAGKPAILDFGEGEACVRWQVEAPKSLGEKQWQLSGRLADGVCQNPPLDAAGLPYRNVQVTFSGHDDLPVAAQTDDKGNFTVTFSEELIDTPARLGSGTSGVTVTAAYYAERDQDEEPVVTAAKVLETHLEVAYADGDQDPDKHIVSPEGTHTLMASLVNWKGETISRASNVEFHAAPADGTDKNALVEGSKVTGVGKKVGVVAVTATLTGHPEFESTPLRIAFGVNAILERTGEHKDEEVLLQRRKGYSSQGRVFVTRHPEGGALYTDEYAVPRLKLTSLLTGLPLEGMDVKWSIVESPENIATFFGSAHKVGSDSGRSAGARASASAARFVTSGTDAQGMVSIPVWARHAAKDKTPSRAAARGSRSHGVAGKGGVQYKRYKTATGVAKVSASFNEGQTQEINIPFIDSLWLMARPTVFPRDWTVNKTTNVAIDVTGYVGVDGKSMAKRKFTGFEYKDYSVQGMGDKDGIGPVFFNSDSASTADVQPFHFPGSGVGPRQPETSCRRVDGLNTPQCSFAGLSTGGESGGATRLKGQFQALTAGKFCLIQKWTSAGVVIDHKGREKAIQNWWGQSGATLKFENGANALCGTAR